MHNDSYNTGTIESYTLIKRDYKGEIFEIVKGGGGKRDRVTFKRPGEPLESYTNLPCEPEGNIYVT